MSVVSQVLVQADDELRYPTIDELESISSFMQTGEQRLRIASILAESEDKIVKKSSAELFKLHPEYISPGGNAYGQKQRAQCLRDFGWYIRVVTYGVISGSKEPIEKIGIIGAREMYNSLGVPMGGMADSIRCLKNAALDLMSKDDAETAAPYFDYVIQAMS
ncbi:allophycocyanin alpha-B subunit apoprotein [Thalassoporum mexicanum PCC 7367]|uniref:allophycocyanin subunit alpha-B n=1 Tax=Thalassoporum mexicanum TaxID=3457544 RepID=UPI00029F9EDC|nr:allophycocyanin subunit alpha-B [Pseudanabaena sp. PCC 7367]AFY69182.1 allophycocyanin alpha-B subunit apoprotein [Pseudanabaena sp. PCC 7367]